MHVSPIHHSFYPGNEKNDKKRTSGAASYKTNSKRGIQLSSLLLGLVALGGSIVLAGCGGITANKASTTGGGSAGSLTASPTSIAFGSVSMGSPATSQVTLTNSSSSAIVVSALTSSNSAFSVDGLGTLPATIAANGSAKLNVHFGPTATGSASGQLVVANNSLISPSINIQLTGTGVSGGTQSGAALTVNSSSVAFGSVPLGTPATQAVTLQSTGSAAVTVSAASVSGTGFTVSGATFPLTINPSQTATLSIQFDPAAAGASTGKLTITSNASSNSSAVVALTGTGVPEAVDLSWSAPSGASVAGYNVYRATGSSSSFQKLNSSVNEPASFMDASVQASTTYQYYVTSVDSSGAESTPSNTATVAVP
jgi:hypothetical protein